MATRWLIDPKKKQYKANLHSHSTLSDGKLTPEELKALFKDNGYDILAITDHEYPKSHNDLTDKDFLMVTGYEAYIRPSRICRFDRFKPEIHINLIAKNKDNEGIVAYDPFYCKYMPLPKAVIAKHYGNIGSRKFTTSYIQKFIDTANANGYLVSLNHPVWSMQDVKSVLKLKNIWSMEIFNTSSMKTSGYAENMPLYDMFLREGNRMFVHGSDDNHNKRAVGDPLCDALGSWTMVSADSLDYKSIVTAMEKGDMYASTGPSIYSIGIDGGEVTVKTSEAAFIRMHMTPKYAKTVYDKKGKAVTEAKFKLPEDASYIYFSVTDKSGGKAYTRAFDIK